MKLCGRMKNSSLFDVQPFVCNGRRTLIYFSTSYAESTPPVASWPDVDVLQQTSLWNVSSSKIYTKPLAESARYTFRTRFAGKAVGWLSGVLSQVWAFGSFGEHSSASQPDTTLRIRLPD
ncbi:hypothetical protein PM082_010011 [Marasmius tenuissimus]|nr:hypothetical protein PM082_010011 [Marasmius tenuissimus]